jgi:hypothetical protein
VDKRTYRKLSQQVFSCLGFVLLAAFLGFAATFATGGARLAVAVPAVLVGALGVRMLFLRVVVTGSGLRVHGPLGNHTYAWDGIERIEVGEDSVNWTNVVPFVNYQWIPVVRLTNGRKVKLTEITSYTMRQRARDATLAARVANELESARAKRAGATA